MCLIGFAHNVYFNWNDLINTRSPNPDKILPYFLGGVHGMFIIMVLQNITYWQIKVFIMLVYFIFAGINVNEFDHPKYFLNLFVGVVLLSRILISLKTNF